MNTHHHENNLLGIIFLIVGFATETIEAVSDLNVLLDFGLKITSFISFMLFIFINWEKIKAFFKWE